MSFVLYLFLVHLGVGISLSLILVSKEAGLKFFRFNAGIAALLLATAMAFRPPTDVIGDTVIGAASITMLGIALATLTIYWLIAGRVLSQLRPILAVVATVAGFIAITLHSLVAATPAVSGGLLTVASALTAVALLGCTCTAMVLGHWYLVIPSMDIRHLQRIVFLHIITLGARIIIVAIALIVALSEPLLTGQSLQQYVVSIDGIFLWQRILFGLAVPMVLAYLTWETAKIRSTQSATGILYVDFFTVMVGEVLSGYLWLSIGLAV